MYFIINVYVIIARQNFSAHSIYLVIVRICFEARI